MTLYEIIIFLQHHIKNGKYIVENVKPYYEPLIEPNLKMDRHLYWCNFEVPVIKVVKDRIHERVNLSTLKDFDLSVYKGIKNKQQVIRNQVNYEVGRHILECAKRGQDGY